MKKTTTIALQSCSLGCRVQTLMDEAFDNLLMDDKKGRR